MDIVALTLGAGLGVLASGLYFMGLAVGIRMALGAPRPGLILLASAAVRMTLLVTAGMLALRLSPEAGLGFFVAFLLVRFTATASTRLFANLAKNA
ncbi:MAG: hypothetical protein HQ481_09895 [Alphaproteobacteria bacterium]|nr:hypothetical protein [Alphaproteobacteria bacterium]